MYSIIWSYKVVSGKENEFEKMYGEEGEWVKLFRKYPDYIKTELHKNLDENSHYITIDNWTSKESYNKFRDQAGSEFEVIDKLGEKLTFSETPLGKFAVL